MHLGKQNNFKLGRGRLFLMMFTVVKIIVKFEKLET